MLHFLIKSKEKRFVKHQLLKYVKYVSEQRIIYIFIFYSLSYHFIIDSLHEKKPTDNMVLEDVIVDDDGMKIFYVMKHQLGLYHNTMNRLYKFGRFLVVI